MTKDKALVRFRALGHPAETYHCLQRTKQLRDFTLTHVLIGPKVSYQITLTICHYPFTCIHLRGDKHHETQTALPT